MSNADKDYSSKGALKKSEHEVLLDEIEKLLENTENKNNLIKVYTVNY